MKPSQKKTNRARHVRPESGQANQESPNVVVNVLADTLTQEVLEVRQRKARTVNDGSRHVVTTKLQIRRGRSVYGIVDGSRSKTNQKLKRKRHGRADVVSNVRKTSLRKERMIQTVDEVIIVAVARERYMNCSEEIS